MSTMRCRECGVVNDEAGIVWHKPGCKSGGTGNLVDVEAEQRDERAHSAGYSEAIRDVCAWLRARGEALRDIHTAMSGAVTGAAGEIEAGEAKGAGGRKT